jgi:hypothetical protein
MSKQELFAWSRAGITVVVVMYLIWRLFLAGTPSVQTEWTDTRDLLSTLFNVLVLVFVVLTRPGKGVVQDERDRAIAALGTKAGFIALTLIVFVSAMIIGSEGHADLLVKRSGGWFEHYLIGCLALGWCVESSVCALHHWRDRR